MNTKKIITSKNDLIDDLIQGCKPQTHFKIGVEHEKFIYDRQNFKRVPYKGGIEKILQELQAYQWQPVYEHQKIIALQRGHASISLEPAGQLELSGAPLSTLHETAQELSLHHTEVTAVLHKLNMVAVSLGYDPVSSVEDLPWMPKERYQIMRHYMPTKGSLGLDMMVNTCTVQVNLDFSSETDMIQKFRIGLALQPLVTALFASSPLSQGHPNGYQSFRHKVWQNTDPDRCGLLQFVFSPDMSFERYVEYMLDVPMYFIKRQGRYYDVAGQSFRDFLNGSLKLPSLTEDDLQITLQDWHEHLTVAFPEVRLKHYLEMRGADGGSISHIQALPAFWTGLLYDEQSLAEVYNLIQDWTFEDIETLYGQVGLKGLNILFQNRSLKEIAFQCLDISQQGLAKRAFQNDQGQDESIYLTYLKNILDHDQTHAQCLLKDYQKFQGNIEKVLQDNVF